MDTDSLNDYGLIEFSPDNGGTWINVTDTAYDQYIDWFEPKPILTGQSNGWTYMHCNLARLGEYFTIDFRDTILLKFTFISDSIQDTLDGLAFDSFEFCDGAEGIERNGYTRISSTVFPNPADQRIVIKFKNRESASFNLNIYDGLANRVLEQIDITSDQVLVNIKSLNSGTYYFSLESEGEREWTRGQFVISRE